MTSRSLQDSQDEVLQQASELLRAGLKREGGMYRLESRLQGNLGVEVMSAGGQLVFSEGDMISRRCLFRHLRRGFIQQGLSSRSLVTRLGDGSSLRVSTSTEPVHEVLETLLRGFLWRARVWAS